MIKCYNMYGNKIKSEVKTGSFQCNRVGYIDQYST